MVPIYNSRNCLTTQDSNNEYDATTDGTDGTDAMQFDGWPWEEGGELDTQQNGQQITLFWR